MRLSISFKRATNSIIVYHSGLSCDGVTECLVSLTAFRSVLTKLLVAQLFAAVVFGSGMSVGTGGHN